MSAIEKLQKILSVTSSSSPLYCRNEQTNKITGIKSSYVSDFYSNYCDSLDIIDDETKFSYSERINPEMSPVIIEFKFKIEEINENESEARTVNNCDDDDFLYKYTFEPRLVQIVQEVIKELFKLSPDKKELLCCTCSNDYTWREGNYSCKYLRLQFPYCISDQEYIYHDIRKKILKKLKKSDLHSEFPRQFKGDWKDVLMPKRDFLPLFGSNEGKKSTKIDIYNFYGEIKDFTNPNNLNDKIYENVLSFFDIERHSKIVKYGEAFTWEEFTDGSDYINHYLPIILSVYYYDKFTNKICDNEKSLDKISNSYADGQSVATDESDIESVRKVKKDAISRCREMLEMISDERMKKKEFIRELGKILYNETDGTKRGLDQWKSIMEEYSMKEGLDILGEYYLYENQPYTWKTLAWYANFDSIESGAFKKWQTDWALETMKEIINTSITDVDVAVLFYKFNMFEFMYHDKIWYQYLERENRMSKLKGKEAVLEKMTTLSEFLAIYGRNQNKMVSDSDDYFKAQREAASVTDVLIKLAEKLKTTSFRTKIVTEAQVLFLRKDLLKHMDNNPSLLCCKNNILELGDDRVNIRKGKPEDFVSKTTGVKYINRGKTDAIRKYLREVFPEDEVHEYMLRDISSYLFGRNSEKKFRSWIGDTNGSKSIFQKIIRKMLGDEHCVVIPIEAFKKKGNGGPSPELAQLKNARIGFVNEADNTDTMSASFIKLLSSGGDIMFARGCGQDGGAIEMNLKVIAVMNSVPNINGADSAVFNRFMMTPFESQWFDEDDDEFKDIPQTFEEQVKKKIFVKDLEYDRKVDILASQLLILAVENYPKYKKNKLKMPEYVSKFMATFWEKNDPIIEFIEDSFDKTESENDVISKRKIFGTYKEWMRTTKPSHLRNMMDEKQLISTLKNKRYFGKSANGTWTGYKIKQSELSDDEDY